MHKRKEDSEPNNLPETLGGLGETEEFHHDIVPQVFSNEPDEDKRDDKGEHDGKKVNVGVAAVFRRVLQLWSHQR